VSPIEGCYLHVEVEGSGVRPFVSGTILLATSIATTPSPGEQEEGRGDPDARHQDREEPPDQGVHDPQRQPAHAEPAEHDRAVERSSPGPIKSPSCSRSCLPAMRPSPPHARRPRPADNRACPRPSSKGSRDQNSSCPTSPNPGLTRVGASRSAISGPDNRAAGRGVLSPGSGALGTCPDSRSSRRSPWPPTPSPSRGSGPRGWRRSGSGQVLRAAIPAASASGGRDR
jgi:hypothetical protein